MTTWWSVFGRKRRNTDNPVHVELPVDLVPSRINALDRDAHQMNWAIRQYPRVITSYYRRLSANVADCLHTQTDMEYVYLLPSPHHFAPFSNFPFGSLTL